MGGVEAPAGREVENSKEHVEGVLVLGFRRHKEAE